MVANGHDRINGKVQTGFEQHYISLREKEGRVYTDEEVLQLPSISKTHPLYNEWKIRKESAKKLAHYLTSKKQGLNILEIGCGNGWLSNYLSLIPGTRVTGLDVNQTELDQAKRLFNKPDLHFVSGELSSGLFPEKSFDIIIFAASFQYFQSAIEILDLSFRFLKNTGEIHIIDTAFYSGIGSITAKERSEQYFIRMGHPEMSDYYFHHSLADLDRYNYRIMFNPASFVNQYLKRSTGLYWISVLPNRTLQKPAT